MILITTHVNADFDCLASMAAAHKLYPSASMIFPGSQEKNVRNFLEKTGFHLPIARLKNFDLEKVKKLVVVDCMSRERLGVLRNLPCREDIELVVYDHHPSQSGDLKSELGRVEQRGATTTLMMEILREKNISVTPEEATLFMLGIYEDTGSLTFSSTCPQDYEAASWLLKQGANLNIVTDFLHRQLNAEQLALLNDLLGRLEIHVINGVEVAIAISSTKRYVGDLAQVAHALKDMENLSALFVMVEMEGRINMVARSRIPAIDAASVAQAFGGGGHMTAASATVRNMFLDEAREKLLKVLVENISPAPTAGEMMVRPVRSANKNETLENVEEILTRQNINALPIVEDGRAIGIITRQTVEKALYHKLGGEKAADYMQTEIVQVGQDVSSEDVKDIVINRKQRIVPVTDDDGKMIGIVSRTDVMRAMYSDILKSPASMMQPQRKIRRPVSRNLSMLMKESLPDEILNLIKKIERCADDCGYTAYAVGGFVRDLIMRRRNFDLDIVIEGDGIDFANRFTARHGGKVKPHKKFKTAVMVLSGHRKIDIATARTEYYTEPAALPIVEMSSIKNDLYRRDFTINALAIKLNGKNKEHLIDFFGGQQDMKDGVLRVLHNLSFIEDPTRIFRAVRFEQRFNLSIGGQTDQLLKLAIKKRLIDRISGSRLLGELQLIFNEESPTRAMARMEELKLWKHLHPALKYDKKLHALCEQVEETIAWHKLTFDHEKIRPWLIYLYCLSTALSERETCEMCERLGFSRQPMQRLLDSRKMILEKTPLLSKLSLDSPVEVYETLHGLTTEVLLVIMAGSTTRKEKRIVAEYLTHMRYVTTKVNGNDLIRAGIKKGPLLGSVMRALLRENLKNTLPTKEDEIRFSKNLYRMLEESTVRT